MLPLLRSAAHHGHPSLKRFALRLASTQLRPPGLPRCGYLATAELLDANAARRAASARLVAEPSTPHAEQSLAANQRFDEALNDILHPSSLVPYDATTPKAVALWRCNTTTRRYFCTATPDKSGTADVERILRAYLSGAHSLCRDTERHGAFDAQSYKDRLLGLDEGLREHGLFGDTAAAGCTRETALALVDDFKALVSDLSRYDNSIALMRTRANQLPSGNSPDESDASEEGAFRRHLRGHTTDPSTPSQRRHFSTAAGQKSYKELREEYDKLIQEHAELSRLYDGPEAIRDHKRMASISRRIRQLAAQLNTFNKKGN
mgnify:CR=1 FL=1